MTKKTGIIVTATYFVAIDKKDYAKQSAAYAALAKIEETGALPDGFIDTATVLSVKAKQGSTDVADATGGETE